MARYKAKKKSVQLNEGICRCEEVRKVPVKGKVYAAERCVCEFVKDPNMELEITGIKYMQLNDKR